MLAHLEFVMHRLLEMMGGWLCALAMTSAVAAALLALLALNLFKFDRDSFSRAARRAGDGFRGGRGWLLAGLALLLQLNGMNELHTGLDRRLKQENQALFVDRDEAGGLPTVQRAPQLSVLQTTERTQSLVVPAGSTLLNALPGWNPEEARAGQQPALNVQDELVQDAAGAAVLKRTYQVQRFAPIKLTRSDANLELTFNGNEAGRRGQIYSATFHARYTLTNPFGEKRKLHFTFPLPEGSGTLAGFSFKVNGQEITTPELEQGVEWTDDVAAGASVPVEVAYTHRGARSWSYDVAGRREPIKDFHLKVHSDGGKVKFERGSLYPTSQQGNELAWDLQNQVTSQSVTLFFPHTATEEVVRHLFVFAPVALLMFSALCYSWARLKRTATTPWMLTLATLTLCAGYTLASYLISYVPLPLALLVAFALTGALQGRALGSRLRFPILAGALAPFAFLLPGHTGLLLTSLALVTLWLTIRQTLRE